jgi:hypothetical protein
MNRAPLTRAYTEMPKFGGTSSVRVTSKGDVRMLAGTVTVAESEAPGGAAAGVTGPLDPEVDESDAGTTGSSLQAVRAIGSSSATATLRGRRE